MTAFLARRPMRLTATVWVVVSTVFLATRLPGNPIDDLMPEAWTPRGAHR